MPVKFIVPRGTIFILIAILLITVGSSAAWVYLPSAVIYIYPETEERSVTQTIILSSEITEPDFVRFVLPARFVEKVIEERHLFSRESGEMHEDFAKGEVVIVNNQDESQPLLPQTHLKHEDTGVYVLTDTPVTIPAQSEISVRVTAKEKGESGNLEPGKFIIDRLPEHLQEVVYAESAHAFSGGIAIDNPLAQEEIDRAEEEVTQKAVDKARGELTAEAGGAVIEEDLLDVSVESTSISAEAGSFASDFSVTVTAVARGFIVDKNDILSLTLLSLRQSEESDEEFVRYKPETFKMEIERADYNTGTAQIIGSLTGIFARKVGPTALSTDNIPGLSANEAKEHFSQFETVGDVDVSFSPFWVNAVPARAGSVDIVVKSGGKE